MKFAQNFQIFPENEETIQTFAETPPTNGYPPTDKLRISLPVPMDTEKKTSYNGSSYSKDSDDYNTSARTSDVLFDERKSSAGRKTISEIVRVDPDKRTRRKRGIIAPHAPFDAARSPVDLQYDKFDKDEG